MSAARVIGTDRQAARLVHFLTEHVQPDLIVVPVDWLPRQGRHWFLSPDLDAIALSLEAWESGGVDRIFGEQGIRVRLPEPGERLPRRTKCPMCGSSGPTVPGERRTVNDLGLLQHR